MRHQSGAKECARPAMRAVDELIRHYHMPRRHILSQGPDRRQGHHIGDAASFQHIDIGAVIDG